MSVPGTTKFDKLRFRQVAECKLGDFIKTTCDMLDIILKLGSAKKVYEGTSETEVSIQRMVFPTLEKSSSAICHKDGTLEMTWWRVSEESTPNVNKLNIGVGRFLRRKGPSMTRFERKR